MKQNLISCRAPLKTNVGRAVARPAQGLVLECLVKLSELSEPVGINKNTYTILSTRTSINTALGKYE